MTLVERFIDFDRWPTSRKSAWAMGLLLALHCIATPVVLYGVAQRPNLIAPGLIVSAWTWLLSIAAAFLISLAAARRGMEGRWTPWLVILPYGAFLAYALYCLGPISTAMTAWLLMIGLIVVMIWGTRIGGIAVVYGLFLLACLLWLQLDPARPYAPALLDRSIDAQRDPLYTGIVLYVVGQTFLACYGLVVLLVSTMRMQQAKIERSNQLIRRYVPSQIADAIISGRAEGDEKHARRKLTIFFSDLVGFTEIAEELEPEDLSRVLNEYFSEMTAIAQKHGGTVDELSGDAILIFFGAPVATDDKDHALRAARMALEMQQAMAGLNTKWRAAGITEALQVRMGINTGVVTIGNFGSPDRMKYAALGKHVNLASRLQAHCESGKVLVSHATWLLVNDQIACVAKGEVQLKGIHKPVMTYELGPSP